jgi:SAM-dependent methyltransferase
MLVPLAARCDEVIGVDVADSMLAEAAKHCAPLDNVKLLKSDDSLSRIDGTFDLIHSSYVLLHVPTSRGEVIVERLAEKLAHGGVAVLEVPLGWHVAKWRKAASWARRKVPGINGFANLVRRRPLGYPLMQLNLYSMNRLFDIMNRHGCATAFISLELDQSVLSATAFFCGRSSGVLTASGPHRITLSGDLKKRRIFTYTQMATGTRSRRNAKAWGTSR